MALSVTLHHDILVGEQLQNIIMENPGSIRRAGRPNRHAQAEAAARCDQQLLLRTTQVEMRETAEELARLLTMIRLKPIMFG